MKKRYVDASRLRKTKKMKITERLSERWVTLAPLLLWCLRLCVDSIRRHPGSPVCREASPRPRGSRVTRSPVRCLRVAVSVRVYPRGRARGECRASYLPRYCLQNRRRSASVQVNVGLLLLGLWHLFPPKLGKIIRSLDVFFFLMIVFSFEAKQLLLQKNTIWNRPDKSPDKKAKTTSFNWIA